MVDGIIIIVTTIILIINLLQRQDEASEEWVGTVMGYLTSVELGGHTVFPRCITVIYQCKKKLSSHHHHHHHHITENPRLGLKVAPVAGSLLVWQTIGSGGQVTLSGCCHF